MGFEFGSSSLRKLNTCHVDVQKIMHRALSKSDIDFGVSEGYRSPERQKLLFDQGKSRIDGISRKGKHNFKPSEAVDIYIYHPVLSTRRTLAYDVGHLCYVAGIIRMVAEELYELGEITHKIRWGGNWDKDGILLLDQSFDDLPHHEIFKP